MTGYTYLVTVEFQVEVDGDEEAAVDLVQEELAALRQKADDSVLTDYTVRKVE